MMHWEWHWLYWIAPIAGAAFGLVIAFGAIRGLIEANVGSGRLLGKATVTLYEDVQEFWVAERLSDHQVVGCGALHVMWEDLAEIRTFGSRVIYERYGRAR